MGFLSSLLGFLGYLIGSVIGLAIGFYFFIYSQPEEADEVIDYFYSSFTFITSFL